MHNPLTLEVDELQQQNHMPIIYVVHSEML